VIGDAARAATKIQATTVAKRRPVFVLEEASARKSGTLTNIVNDAATATNSHSGQSLSAPITLAQAFALAGSIDTPSPID
jgi:hypothetical protein